MTSPPDDPETLYQQAIALHGNGRLGEADALYLKIFASHPDHYGLLYFLGLLRLQQGRFAEALDFTQRALRINPSSARPLLQQSLVLLKLRRLGPALASIEKALATSPDEPDLWKCRGDILLELGRFPDAVASYDRALARAPDHSDALTNRGAALLALNRPEEALPCFARALALTPHDATALGNHARVLMALERPAEALADYDRALALQPDSRDALLGHGVALLKLDRPRAALDGFDRMLALHADFAEGFYNRAEALLALGDPEGAIANYDQAIVRKSDYAEALVNKGLVLLARQDFAAGWPLYEWRKKLPGFAARSCPAPLWLGEQDISGKILFVHHEQGLGDTLQFCRYAQLAEAKGITVVLAVQDRLVRLLRGMIPPVEIIGSKETPAAFDFYTSLLSLPLAFGTDRDNIPAAPFYLKPEPALVDKWKNKIGDHGFKIGIVWQGDKRGAIEIGRSFALRQLEGLARLPGLRLISLQKNAGVEQLADLPPGMTVESLGEDFDAGADAFVDTAAVMENLDLIIAPDTSIAHLAGALGRRVWLALQYHHDWRWFGGRDDTPWYPATRLFRQPASGDWQSVFAAMASQLAAQMPSG